MEPTPEQSTIIAFARQRTENLVVNALAGTGKTSTIELVARALTTIPILYLVFNKRNQVEAEKRMPSHVECRTQNALGHRTWAAFTGKRLSLSSDKMREIVKAIINERPRDLRGPLWDEYSDIMKFIQSAKRMGAVPESWKGDCKPALTWCEFLQSTADLPFSLDIVEEALRRSIEQAYAGHIDFDDQIYMPVIFGGSWPRFPLVIIDEAQDLNPLGHAMLAKLVTKRLIAVGDPWQSIYGFRGAVANGMKELIRYYEAEQLPLSVTFRVPKAGVERVRTRIPFYEAFHANPEGIVSRPEEWGTRDIPEEATILCRYNAPLISLAFRLLSNSRPCKMPGFDIGANLVKTLRKLGPPELSAGPLAAAISQWESRELERTGKESVYDRADCLRALCAGRENLAEAISSAEALFKSEGPITLMSIHKAKGLEWPVVFHLDSWRVPGSRIRPGTEEYEQELNCLYVAETRFQRELHIVDSRDWVDG